MIGATQIYCQSYHDPKSGEKSFRFRLVAKKTEEELKEYLGKPLAIADGSNSLAYADFRHDPKSMAPDEIKLSYIETSKGYGRHGLATALLEAAHLVLSKDFNKITGVLTKDPRAIPFYNNLEFDQTIDKRGRIIVETTMDNPKLKTFNKYKPNETMRGVAASCEPVD